MTRISQQSDDLVVCKGTVRCITGPTPVEETILTTKALNDTGNIYRAAASLTNCVNGIENNKKRTVRAPSRDWPAPVRHASQQHESGVQYLFLPKSTS